MRLLKKHGGATIGPYEWHVDGAVCDVDDATAAALIEAAPDEWSEVVTGTPVDEPARRGPGRPRKSQIITE